MASASQGSGADQPGAQNLAASAPADGWLTDASSLYRLDGASLTLSPVGSVDREFSALTTAPNGELYGIGPADGGTPTLYTIAASTGSATAIGPLVEPESGVLFTGLAALADGRMLAVSEDIRAAFDGSTEGQTWTVNPQTGEATALGDPTEVITTLTSGCGGVVHGTDMWNRLVRIDSRTGIVREGEMVELGPGESPRALAMDHRLRDLHLLTLDTGTGSAASLYDVDPGTGATTNTSYVPGQPAGADPATLTFDPPTSCRYQGTLGLRWSDRWHRFHGALVAQDKYAPCRAQRPVRVMRVRNGPDAKVGTTTTSRTGQFRLATGGRSGLYYAIAPAVDRQGVCLRAESPKLRVGATG